jgi:hypothetical protein
MLGCHIILFSNLVWPCLKPAPTEPEGQSDLQMAGAAAGRKINVNLKASGFFLLTEVECVSYAGYFFR